MAENRTVSLRGVLILSLLLAAGTAAGLEHGLFALPARPLTFAGAFVTGLVALVLLDPPLGPHSAFFGALAISVPPSLFAVLALLFGAPVPGLFVFFRFLAVWTAWAALLAVLAVFAAERRG